MAMTQGNVPLDTELRHFFDNNLSRTYSFVELSIFFLYHPPLSICAYERVSKMPIQWTPSRLLKSPVPMTVEDLAEDFLCTLPNIRRGELTAEDQKCCICLEPFGTTPSERGVIERPKHLPCGHIVGSEVSKISVLTS